MSSDSSPASSSPQHNLAEEAAAFDQRITERRQAGFVPDLRRAVKCDYFYRRRRIPFRAALRRWISGESPGFLNRYGSPGMSLLDVGCGPGYYSLEFARSGYCVTGIDIAARRLLLHKAH